MTSVSSTSSAPRQRSYASRGSRTLAMLVHLAFVPTGMVTTFLGPMLPALSLRWQLSDAQAGYFFTAQFLGSIVGVALTSILLPRLGFRFSLAIGYVLIAAAVRGLALTDWSWSLLRTLCSGRGRGRVIAPSNC